MPGNCRVAAHLRQSQSLFLHFLQQFKALFKWNCVVVSVDNVSLFLGETCWFPLVLEDEHCVQ